MAVTLIIIPNIRNKFSVFVILAAWALLHPIPFLIQFKGWQSAGTVIRTIHFKINCMWHLWRNWHNQGLICAGCASCAIAFSLNLFFVFPPLHMLEQIPVL